MPKRFQFRLQRFLDYRTFKTGQARRKIARRAAELEQAESAFHEASGKVEAAKEAIARNQSELLEVRRQSWESPGDWSRTIERVRQSVTDAESERGLLKAQCEKAGQEVRARQLPLRDARVAHLQAQRFEDGLNAMRTQQEREFRELQEAAEMEDAAEAFSAIAWIERGES